MRYNWPGNVRELRNTIENMVLLSRENVLSIDDVPEPIRATQSTPLSGSASLAGRSLAEVERELIQSNLDFVDGNRAKAAKILGMGERTLYRKIKEYDL